MFSFIYNFFATIFCFNLNTKKYTKEKLLNHFPPQIVNKLYQYDYPLKTSYGLKTCMMDIDLTNSGGILILKFYGLISYFFPYKEMQIAFTKQQWFGSTVFYNGVPFEKFTNSLSGEKMSNREICDEENAICASLHN